MNRNKIILFTIAATLAVFASGCKTTSSNSVYVPRETNILGIIKHQPQSYATVGTNTFHISSDEIRARKDFSGDKTTLLWGLITLTDY